MMLSMNEEDFKSMTLGELEQLFNMAEGINALEEVTDEFWSRFSHNGKDYVKGHSVLDYVKVILANVSSLRREQQELRQLVVAKHADLRHLIVTEAMEIKRMLVNK